jgi:hypothetical protein
MKNRLSPWNLGATLYMPATRYDIEGAILDGKIPDFARWSFVWRMRSVKQISPGRWKI